MSPDAVPAATSIAQLSAKDPNWLTPLAIVEAARVALGGTIDLDPASCSEANAGIKAHLWYGDQGLERTWHGAVFLNPPGGRAVPGLRSNSNAVCWWLKLIDEVKSGRVTKAVFVAFASETLLQSVQLSDGFERKGGGVRARYATASAWPLDHNAFWPAERIRFEHCDASDPMVRIGGPQPTHGNVIIGVGIKSKAFAEAFAPLRGVVMGAP